MLKLNQSIKLKPQSSIFNKIYNSEIIKINDYTFTINMPYENGKIVLLSVGTVVEIELNDKNTFISEVIERSFTPKPALTLTIPYNLLNKVNRIGKAKVVSITSGKGGVGKTSFTINLGIALSQMGYRTFIIDADLGTANVDVLLNLQPKYNITHVLNKEKEILDIIIDGPGGIYLIPGGSGFQNLTELNENQFTRLIQSFQTLEQFADIILIDTGAGLSKNVVNFLLASDEVLVITTPEPHAITDAYAIIKVLDDQKTKLKPRLIINKVESPEEGKQIAEKIIKVTNQFLDIKIENLGYILDDKNVLRAIKKLRPFTLSSPQSPASLCIKNIACRLIKPDFYQEKEIKRNFLHRVKELFSR